MLRVILKLFCVFLLFFKFECFNLDTYHPIIYTDPNPQDRNKSYFGYSVILYPEKNGHSSGIKVGSPKSTNPKITGLENVKPGVVYDCPFMKICQINELDSWTYKGVAQNMDDLWIGGSMDIGPKYEHWAVSAFRWKYRPLNNELGQSFGVNMIGASSWFNLTTDRSFDMSPFDNARRSLSGRIFWYGMAEAGFSTHIPSVDDPEVILGAPGVFNWAGTVLKIKSVEIRTPPVSRSLDGSNGKRAKTEGYTTFETYKANARKSNLNQEFEYFGYSLTSGYFFGKNEPIFYASGSPRAGTYKGKVSIFQFQESDDLPLIPKQVQQGTQLGEYFGASLAAGDINGDGYDDLLVGAPFHQSGEYNEGSVYVFYGDKLQLNLRYDQIRGTARNGQFGTTIMFMADIDNDGYGDVAIGAPFEDELRGAIYIYKGSKFKLEPQPSQKILGRDVYEELRGFGISISRPADIDNNGNKDVAVGAHISGHVVVLRGYPIVEIKATLEPYLAAVERTVEEVTFKACFEYDKFTAKPNISISRQFEIESGTGVVNNAPEKPKILLLKYGEPLCENITVFINNKRSGYLEPITAKLSYKLEENPKIKSVVLITDSINDTFCHTCPIFDRTKSTAQIITRRVPYVLKSGEDNECKSTLEVNWQFLNLRGNDVLVLGSQDSMTVKFEVRNHGNKTYDPQLEFTLPETVSLRQRLTKCDTTKNESVVLCKVDNSIEADQTIFLEIDLDIKNLDTGLLTNELNIFVKALTCGINVGNNTNTSFAIKLISEADITITGESGDQSYPFEYISGNSTEQKPNFTQIYKVEKIGVSTIESIRIEIKVPYAFQTPSGLINFINLYQPEGSFRGQPITCQSNFKYILDEKQEMTTSLEDNEDNLMEDLKITSRLKRDVETSISKNEFKVLSNMTLYINCSNPLVVCSSIICRSGPFESNQHQAEIQLKMVLNVTNRLLKFNSTVVFTTQGIVVVISPKGFQQSGKRPDMAEVSSFFINERVFKGKVALWIIISSGVGGIILLLLVTLGLCKAGFFKRYTKEQLQLLKAEAKEEDEKMQNMMVEADIEPMELEPMDIPEGSPSISTEVLTEEKLKT